MLTRKTITWKTKYCDLPEKMDLTDIEKAKRDKLAELLRETADIVKKYIDKFKDDKDYKYVVPGLERGLDNLESGINLIMKKDGFIVQHLMQPINKRGGCGLRRGFGEFLWEGYDWQKEIMNAVNAVEDYYSEM